MPGPVAHVEAWHRLSDGTELVLGHERPGDLGTLWHRAPGGDWLEVGEGVARGLTGDGSRVWLTGYGGADYNGLVEIDCGVEAR